MYHSLPSSRHQAQQLPSAVASSRLQRNTYQSTTRLSPPSQSAWELLWQYHQQQKEAKIVSGRGIGFPTLLDGSSSFDEGDQKEGCHDFLTLSHPGVYELAGPAGSGKTQIALYLCLCEAAAAVQDEDDDELDEEQSASSLPCSRHRNDKGQEREEGYHPIPSDTVHSKALRGSLHSNIDRDNRNGTFDGSLPSHNGHDNTTVAGNAEHTVGAPSNYTNNNETAIPTTTTTSTSSVSRRHSTITSYRAVYFSLGGMAKRDKILQRLSQMAEAMVSSDHLKHHHRRRLLERIATRCVYNQDDWLHDILHVQLPELLQGQHHTSPVLKLQQSNSHLPQKRSRSRTSSRASSGIRVVVVDALADLYRGVVLPHHRRHNQHHSTLTTTTAQDSVVERAAQLCQVAQRLQQLAHQYQVVFLVLNQVSGQDHQPALGLVWAHACTASFLVATSTTTTTTLSSSCHGNTGSKKAQPTTTNTKDENPENHHKPPQMSSKLIPKHQPPQQQRRRTLILRHSPLHGGPGKEVDFYIDRSGVHAYNNGNF